MIKGFYNGCSVKLRSGKVITNVWHAPDLTEGSQLVALKKAAAVPPDMTAGDIKRLVPGIAGWFESGSYFREGTSSNDIVEVLPKKQPKKEDMPKNLEGFYNGCSVRLRNGRVAKNVWKTPMCGSTRKLSALGNGHTISGDESGNWVMANPQDQRADAQERP